MNVAVSPRVTKSQTAKVICWIHMAVAQMLPYEGTDYTWMRQNIHARNQNPLPCFPQVLRSFCAIHRHGFVEGRKRATQTQTKHRLEAPFFPLFRIDLRYPMAPTIPAQAPATFHINQHLVSSSFPILKWP